MGECGCKPVKEVIISLDDGNVLGLAIWKECESCESVAGIEVYRDPSRMKMAIEEFEALTLSVDVDNSQWIWEEEYATQ